VTVNRIGRGQVIFCAIPDLLGLDERITPVASHTLTHLFAVASPVLIKGDVEHLINRTPRGWVVTLINNFGVNKPQQGMAQIDRTAVVDVELSLAGRGIERAQEWTTNETLDVTRSAKGESIKLRIPPGGVRIVELLTRR
jgi:hypothetical protein